MIRAHLSSFLPAQGPRGERGPRGITGKPGPKVGFQCFLGCLPCYPQSCTCGSSWPFHLEKQTNKKKEDISLRVFKKELVQQHSDRSG